MYKVLVFVIIAATLNQEVPIAAEGKLIFPDAVQTQEKSSSPHSPPPEEDAEAPTLRNMPEHLRHSVAPLGRNLGPGSVVPCRAQIDLRLNQIYFLDIKSGHRPGSSCNWLMVAESPGARLRLNCEASGSFSSDCVYGDILRVYVDSWQRPRRYCGYDWPVHLTSRYNWLAVSYTNSLYPPQVQGHRSSRCSIIAYDPEAPAPPVPPFPASSSSSNFISSSSSTSTTNGPDASFRNCDFAARNLSVNCQPENA
ncbi:uncharacterized protein LOC143032536 [Oratosquilla oratoria]|uniref:uncharacterized protein LOC143032536 n=1 Tax=Oratosquilla oratoria TaxID=337810 RepID=UPI003F7698E3